MQVRSVSDAEMNGEEASDATQESPSSSSSVWHAAFPSPSNGFPSLVASVSPEDRQRERKFSLSNPPMPWFGMDIGGTLVKLVYFEPLDHNEWPPGTLEAEKQTTRNIQKYLTQNRCYGETGIRDEHLELDDMQINSRRGRLHFIRFPTAQMGDFLQLAAKKDLAKVASTVCATGGGAIKFESLVQKELDVQFYKFDELESVIHGLEFTFAQNTQGECFFWDNPTEPQPQLKPFPCRGLNYPYLVVNIGSGVSILSVRGPRDFKRVSGSSLGGGMFLGLCALLTGCSTFEEALELAAKGDNTKVDKLVRDIYGGDYNLFGLPGDTVASSFAQMIDPERRNSAAKEDLARAALVTITNNIASIARLCAAAEGVEHVLYVGNFLRVNPIASKRLAFAMHYWSDGKIRALFMQHEGYFGAVGCLLELMRISEHRRKQRQIAEAAFQRDMEAS